MKWSSEMLRLLGVKYPVIQAPMFGVTTPEMVAAAARAGAMGSLALGDLPADKCVEAIRAVKKQTALPFAVNIFVNEVPAVTAELREAYEKARHFISDLAAAHGLDVRLPGIETFTITDYRDQVQAILDENVAVLSFTFGNLDGESIHMLKQNGTVLIGTCTSVAEALMLERTGIDLICVQGIEAGGHRGSFSPEAVPQIGGFALLPQVYDEVRVPLIYAGGIRNASMLQAATMLGARGFQIGSLLLGSQESALQPFEKQRLRSVYENDLLLTRSFSGRYARGIRNTFIQAMEHSGLVLPYPYQNKLTGALRQKARELENADFVNIWAGQSINPYSAASTTEIIRSLIAETECMF